MMAGVSAESLRDTAAARPRAAGGLLFAYQSGSRPLDGYTIKRGVGRGGFGEVYYAVSDAGKEVALKLDPPQPRRRAARRDPVPEPQAPQPGQPVRHPPGRARGDSWVVMEYVAGESLEDMILPAIPTACRRTRPWQWFDGMCARGVAYLHDHGIVHRDLKPGNIFLDEGIVKIGDYGLSKFISRSRRSGQTESVGTVHYMAPEIANGRYGKEIDIYALGIILYEMLTGHVPFEGESIGEVLMKHLTAEPDLSRVPAQFRPIVARLLRKDPDQRYPTVPALVEDIDAALAGRPLHVADAASIRTVDASCVKAASRRRGRDRKRPSG